MIQRCLYTMRMVPLAGLRGKGDNPLANLLGRQNELRKDWLNGNTYLEIKPIPELTGRVNAGVEIAHNFTGRYLPRSTYQGALTMGWPVPMMAL